MAAGSKAVGRAAPASTLGDPQQLHPLVPEEWGWLRREGSSTHRSTGPKTLMLRMQGGAATCTCLHLTDLGHPKSHRW